MPSDRVCPDADINYKYTYDSICYEAYLKALEERRQRKR